MRRLVLLTITVSAVGLIAVQPASAANYAETQIVFAHDRASSAIALMNAETTFGRSPFGAGAYGFITPTGGEMFIGPSWTPAPWTTVFAYVGAKQTGGQLGDTYALVPIMSRGPWFATVTVEADRAALGGSNAAGWWYDGRATYNPFSALALGAHSRANVGSGPTVRLRVPSTRLTVWGTWMFAPSVKLDPNRQSEGFEAGRGIISLRLDL